MNLESILSSNIIAALKAAYDHDADAAKITFQPTKKEFEGSITFVTFPFTKVLRKKPEDIGQTLGEYLVKEVESITGFNVVKGFLNLSVSDKVWLDMLGNVAQKSDLGQLASTGTKIMVEYSSPNTNKPLHLGHMRNNFLGYSLSQILSAAGHEVLKVNLVNDRGIHICKSMLAYERFGNNEQPSASLKGDKLVGNYYVAFDKAYKAEVAELLAQYKAEQPDEKEEKLKAQAEKDAPILKEAQAMLRKWESKDPEVMALWKKMNGWVYDGFNTTYKNIGVDFDKFYYESDTYLLGKDIVDEGLAKGLLFKKDDGSVWIDLKEDGLDEKLLLRGDGTSVYMTQDLGTADLKSKDFPMDHSVYVVGNEQDYHFKVLKLILQKMGRPYADGIYHMSYGMVELPHGKMKSREGTVVDADDLVQEMVDTAQSRTEELGKIDGFSEEEASTLYKQLALGALKYYLLRVDPKKKMLFNPEESVDFHGDTGVYIHYNHAKISAILRKAAQEGHDVSDTGFLSNLSDIAPIEQEIIRALGNFESKVAEAAKEFAPSVIGNYLYDLAKLYSKLYSELSIFSEPDKNKVLLRVLLSAQTARVLKLAGNLLGIQMPERM